MFFAGPNFLCQTKNLLQYVAVTNILGQAKRWFAFSRIGFWVGTKGFEEALNTAKFLGWPKKFGPARNNLGPVKGQGINDFTNLSCKLLQIQIASVSGHILHFIFKTCQIVAGTSRYVWHVSFTNFSISFLAGFWRLAQLCSVSLCCLLGLCVKRAPPYSQFTSKTRAYCWEHTTTAPPTHSWAK